MRQLEEEVPDQRANALHNYTQFENIGGKISGLYEKTLSEERRGFNLPPPGISQSPWRAS